jgi:eukaryotic-like serine/threonine-protein kinase
MECPACQKPNIDGARFCAKCGALLPASPAEGADPLIGAVVGGRFRITGVLGEGGMGRVYTGEQQMGTSVRKVAVKTLLAQFAKDPQVLARFMRECGTVSELEHPNTIKVFDFGQTDSGELYIAMELLSGVSLEAALEKGPLHADRVDRILGQVCGSLQEAHEKGIVHRDLKPANIYLTTRAGQEDYVKVLDFGIAKHDDEHSKKQEEKLTQQGTVLGTPPYMSPEQFKGSKLDARSDIYSIGVVTYEMLTGRLPFDADTPWLWATQHMTAQPFPFETLPLGSQVPSKMRAAVMRALSKDAAHRQQTVGEFYDELTLGAPAVSAFSGPRSSLPEGPSGTAFMPTMPTPTSSGTAAMPATNGAMVATSSPGTPVKKSKTGLLIGAGVVVAAAVGVVLFLTLGGDDGGKQCKAAITAANAGNVVQATIHYKACSGGSKAAARSAIDAAAMKSAARPGCAGLEDARAAEKVGITAAFNELKTKHCH